MTVITLSTDFGTGDPEAGVLKGVIWKIAPTAQLVDLSHAITPQHVLEAAWLLWRAAPYFPPGTIHLAIVDPGVGTSRRGIACQIGTQYYVGPDNGIFTLVLTKAEADHNKVRIIHLDQPKYWLPEVSTVFHGRDVFAPVAAHLAAGVLINALGSPIMDPVRLEIPGPIRTSTGWLAEVIHIDHFGNLSTNLNASHLSGVKEVVIQIKGKNIIGLAFTFGERPTGTLVGLLDSSGFLAISLVNGSAAKFLQVSVGERVELFIKDKS